jgi:hypothetical protein
VSDCHSDVPKPVTRTPPVKIHRCGGRKIPASFTREDTRMVYRRRW